jgi:hypothetical protein
MVYNEVMVTAYDDLLAELLDEDEGLDLGTENPESVKFNLYIKNEEIKAIYESLKHVMLLPKAQREDWVQVNQKIIHKLLQQFMDDSVLALNGADLEDPEGRKLSMEYVTGLRDTMNVIRGIFKEPKKLRT